MSCKYTNKRAKNTNLLEYFSKQTSVYSKCTLNIDIKMAKQRTVSPNK